MPQSAAQRKAAERDRMRALGLVLRQVWVHPKDWERVRKYIDRLLGRHLK
jgi:hypothetical protein